MVEVDSERTSCEVRTDREGKFFVNTRRWEYAQNFGQETSGKRSHWSTVNRRMILKWILKHYDVRV